jgi:hypothetical protein
LPARVREHALELAPRVVVAAGMSVDALACWGSDVDFTRRS